MHTPRFVVESLEMRVAGWYGDLDVAAAREAVDGLEEGTGQSATLMAAAHAQHVDVVVRATVAERGRRPAVRRVALPGVVAGVDLREAAQHALEAAAQAVALSGGVWQNITLLGRTLSLLKRGGFRVYLHREVPPNDGGLSLGQAVIAAARMRG